MYQFKILLSFARFKLLDAKFAKKREELLFNFCFPVLS
jgi:hypothetical protein